MNGTESLFFTRGLSVSLRERGKTLPVVFPADIAVKAGGCTGIVGESGCGKSLLCKAVLGLLTERKWQVEGEVFLEGERLPLEDDKEMDAFRGRRISMIVQDPLSAFDPRMTVGSHFMEGVKRRDRKSRRQEAAASLERMLLKDPEALMRQYPFELSGGMLQRALIALSLFAGPGMLIADEPTTALDSTVQEEILQLLESLLRNEGLSLLLVSHDLKVISRMADTVCVMYAGRIVECGSLKEVQETPLHPYTAGLFSSRPAFSKERLPVMEGRPPVLERLSEPGCPFVPRCPAAGEACRERVPSFEAAGGTHLVRCGRREAWESVVKGSAEAGLGEDGRNRKGRQRTWGKKTKRCLFWRSAGSAGATGAGRENRPRRYGRFLFLWKGGGASAWWGRAAAGKAPFAASLRESKNRISER